MEYLTASPDLWNRRQETGKSASELFNENGVYIRKRSNDRIQGWLNVKEWLKVKPEYEVYDCQKENLCVINVRGGEYESSTELYLRRKYWLDAIKQMKKIQIKK